MAPYALSIYYIGINGKIMMNFVEISQNIHLFLDSDEILLYIESMAYIMKALLDV
jgi:hypothetical protein